MIEGVLELLVLGKIPGTEIYMDYASSMIVAGILTALLVFGFAHRYYRSVIQRLRHYSPEKLIEFKTL